MLKLIPHILTFGRLVLSIIFLIMLLYSVRITDAGDKTFFLDAAFVLFIVSGLTDIFDGMAARKFNVTSKLGRIMDPLVDKVLVCGTFICFALIGEPKLFNFSPAILAVIQWSVAAVLIAREAYVTVLRHICEAKGISFPATMSGKLKMFVQSFAIGTVVIKMTHVKMAAWGNWFTAVIFLLMIVITIISGINATRRKSWKMAAAK
jgi:CDP-diacylglycerol---glycerol-3-phosphate 3-phosphatidyltransferase